MATATETGRAAQRVRVALFGSFYRGYYMLHELHQGPISRRVEVVGVASDDPSQSYVSPGRRLWSYPHQPFEETMVPDLARRLGVPCHTGRVKTEDFRKTYCESWRPQLVVSGTFGQLIDAPLFEFPALGFYNTHPCNGPQWPSPYAGPNPFQALIDDGASSVNIAFHAVNAQFDAGALRAMSDPIPIPPGVGVIDLHKLTGPLVARFVAAEIARLLDESGLAQT